MFQKSKCILLFSCRYSLDRQSKIDGPGALERKPYVPLNRWACTLHWYWPEIALLTLHWDQPNNQATLFQHDPQLPVRKQAEQRQDSTHWGGNEDNNPGGDLNNEDPLVGSHQQETQETNPDATKDKPSPGDNNCQVTQALQRSSTFSKDRGCKILTGGPSSHQVLVIISLLQSLSFFYSH